MTTQEEGAPAGADRRAQVVALLKRYPEVTGEELGFLRHWFGKEASALDVGTLASEPEIAEGYARFRKEHIDRFGMRDIVILVIALAVVAGAIAWLAA